MVQDWQEARPLLSDAVAVLVGGALAGLPAPEVVLRELEAVRSVIWVAEDEAIHWRPWLRGGDALWTGTLEQRRMDEWIGQMLAPSLTVPRQLAVWSAAGFVDRRALFGRLVEAATEAYGPGVLVDLAWNDPQLTYHSRLAAHSGMAGEPARLWSRRARYGAFVPAPPPWEPIWARPGREDLEALVARHKGQWLAIDMGSDLRSTLWPSVLAQSEITYLVVPETPWEKPLAEAFGLLRSLRHDARFGLVGDRGKGQWWRSLGWPGLEVVDPGPVVKAGPGKEGWRWPIFSRGRRGTADRTSRGPKPPKRN